MVVENPWMGSHFFGELPGSLDFFDFIWFHMGMEWGENWGPLGTPEPAKHSWTHGSFDLLESLVSELVERFWGWIKQHSHHIQWMNEQWRLVHLHTSWPSPTSTLRKQHIKKKIKGSYLNLSSKPLPTETMHQNYWTNLGCTSTSGNQELLLVFSECINAISLQTKDLSKGGRIGTGSTLGL